MKKTIPRSDKKNPSYKKYKQPKNRLKIKPFLIKKTSN